MADQAVVTQDGSRATQTQGDPKISVTQNRIRRRNRMITSCLECRRRKLKCDKSQPCTNCSKFSRDCVFLAPALDSVSQQKLNEIKEKMGSLERVLESDVAGKQQKANRRSANKPTVGLPGQDDTDSDAEAMVPDDERDLEPTPLAVVDASYEDDANDDMFDLGVKMGKMRMTERLGGFFRPKMTEELAFTLSNPSMDRRTAEEKAASLPLSPSSAEAFLDPGPVYIAPGSGFTFGDVGGKTNLMDFLPSKFAADTLVEQYQKNVHHIARVVHWPSFQVQYDNFWTNVLVGIEPTASLQAIVFAVLFSAVASMPEEDVSQCFQRPKRTVLTNFQTGTEVALGKAHFLRTTKMETLQALIVYLIPMCRSEMSRAHSVLVGAAIRLAECMGLHRDPAGVYGLPPVECHVRRMLWCQLCFLDIRTCESQGPRPCIRREDYDTRFPLNVDDADLLRAEPQETDTAWTDMTFSRIRFESNEMHRVVWNDRIRLEKKQVSLTHVLGKIESFRRAMEAKYYPILDTTIPIQRCARFAMDILLLRMHIMVLHRYHNSVSVRIPDRLRQIIITSGTTQLESAIKLETDPELAPWRWYGGAFQQYHTAFLLLVEIFTYPMRKEADRIWAVIDYVFETDRSLSRTMKARSILGELRDKTAIYRDIRKIRAPVSMMKRLAQKPPPRTDALIPMNALPPQNTRDASDNRTQMPTNDSRSPASTADPTVHSWTFDSPSTQFSKPFWERTPSTNEQPNPGLTWPQQQQQQQQLPLPPQVPDFSLGSSPANASTPDSWPPFIRQGQQGWSAPDASPRDKTMNDAAVSSNRNVNTNVSSSGPGISSALPDDIAAMGTAQQDGVMLDIDWSEWDKIFPPDINNGVLNMT